MANELMLLGCGPAGAGGSAYLLRDTFTDTAGTALTAHTMNVGDGWTGVGGQVAEVATGNRVRVTTGGAAYEAVLADAGAADATLLFEVDNRGTGNWQAVCGRVNPADASGWFLFVKGTGDAVELYESTGAAYTSRGSAALPTYGPCPLTLEFSGTTITVKSGDETLLTYGSASRNQGQTHFGLNGNTTNGGTRWRNFKVVANGTANPYAAPEAGSGLYLLPYFLGEGAANEVLRVAMSDDGNYWQAVPANYTPDGGQTVRDPDILWHGGAWWLVHSTVTGATYEGTSFAVASSEDGVNWAHVATVDCSAVPGMTKAWSPLWFVDPADDSVHVLVSVALTADGTDFQSYEVHPTNAGMTSWSGLTLVTGTSMRANYIDGKVLREGGSYYLTFKNETTKVIEVYKSASPFSGYAAHRTGDWMGLGVPLEGATFLRVGGAWRVYADRYEAGTGMAYTTETAGDWLGDGSTTWGATLTTLDGPALVMRNGRPTLPE